MQRLVCHIKLKEIIENDCAKYSLTYKLQKNEGIITNNILHGRKAFKDDKVKKTFKDQILREVIMLYLVRY